MKKIIKDKSEYVPEWFAFGMAMFCMAMGVLNIFELINLNSSKTQVYHTNEVTLINYVNFGSWDNRVNIFWRTNEVNHTNFVEVATHTNEVFYVKEVWHTNEVTNYYNAPPRPYEPPFDHMPMNNWDCPVIRYPSTNGAILLTNIYITNDIQGWITNHTYRGW